MLCLGQWPLGIFMTADSVHVCMCVWVTETWMDFCEQMCMKSGANGVRS